MSISQWIIAHFFEIIGYLLAIVLIPRILLERHRPGATVAWLLAIGLIPAVGVPLYFLIGGHRVKRIRKKLSPDLRVPSPDDPNPPDDSLPADCRQTVRLLSRSGAFPPVAGNRIRVIADGIEAYRTLADLVEQAESSIDVATFILGRDEVGRGLVRRLARKARRGVRVRLLLDALGCLTTRGAFVQPLRDAGGQVGIFLPLLPVRRRWSANLRNHRKIAVADGRRALVGGMNLAREYMGPKPYPRRWKDVMMEIYGPGAADIRRVFLQDWQFATGNDAGSDSLLDADDPPAADGSILQVVADGPDMESRPLYSGVLAALNQARESIWVVTPYFVPDEPISAALQLASRKGCDVRLILPERSNHPLVDLAGRSFFSELMAAGVRFYLYRPGMLHAKLIGIDRQLAVVGTANMDIRSFQLNFEVATFLYHPHDVGQVLGVMEAVMAKSRLLPPQEAARKSKIRRFSEDICRVFSPLL